MPFELPAQLTTPLDAVNAMLATIAQEPVTALEPSQSAYADKALVALQNADLLIQSKGMEANREYNWPLSMDADFKVPVPANTLRIDASYCSQEKRRLTQRGGFMYDRERRTFDFSGQGEVTVDAILRLTWEDLPQTARTLIWAMAAQRFQVHEQTSSVVDRVEQQHIALAAAIHEQHEDEVDPQNGIEGNLSVQGATRNFGRIRRPRG